jgi:hypothetical protein
MGQTQSGVISIDDFGNRVMGAAVVLLSSQLDTGLTFKHVNQIQPTDAHVLPLLTDAPESNPSIEKLVELYSNYYNDDKREAINKYISDHILDREEHLHAFISLLINNLRAKKTPAAAPAPPVNYFSEEPAAPAKQAGGGSGSSKTKEKSDFKQPHAPPSVASASTVKTAAASQSVRTKKSVAVVPEEHRSIKQSQESFRSLAAAPSFHSVHTVTENENPILKSNPTSSVHSGILSTLETPVVSEFTASRISALQPVRPVKGSNKLQKRMHAVDQAIDAERLLSQVKENIDLSYKEETAFTASTKDLEAEEGETTEHSGDEFEHL